jgi:hypothetical protein
MSINKVYYLPAAVLCNPLESQIMIFRELPQDFVAYRLPKPSPSGITAHGFCACPAVLIQGLTAGETRARVAAYQLAFEQAQIEATPSLLERDLLAFWS